MARLLHLGFAWVELNACFRRFGDDGRFTGELGAVDARPEAHFEQ